MDNKRYVLNKNGLILLLTTTLVLTGTSNIIDCIITKILAITTLSITIKLADHLPKKNINKLLQMY